MKVRIEVMNTRQKVSVEQVSQSSARLFFKVLHCQACKVYTMWCFSCQKWQVPSNAIFNAWTLINPIFIAYNL